MLELVPAGKAIAARQWSMQLFDGFHFPFALGKVQEENGERGSKAHGRSMNRQLHGHRPEQSGRNKTMFACP
jgi:hypothetical protein